MTIRQPSTPLSRLLPPLVLGGAGFSHQVFKNPTSAQALQVLKGAFQLGLRAIDTSAYYHPSEILLGEALSHPDIACNYTRDQYLLMTKVGRITATQFDYSSAWVRQSVTRSLERLRTHYLDVVFCHDVEFVPEEEVLRRRRSCWWSSRCAPRPARPTPRRSASAVTATRRAPAT